MAKVQTPGIAGGDGDAALHVWLAEVLAGVDPLAVAAWAADQLVVEEPTAVGAREQAVALAAVVDRLGVATVRAVGKVSASGTWRVDGATSAQAWVRHHCRVAGSVAAQWTAAGRVAHRYQPVVEALVDGAIGVDAAARLGRAGCRRRQSLFERDVEVLVEHARRLAPDDLALVLTRWEALADDELADEDARNREEHRGFWVAPTVGGVKVRGWLGVEGAFVLAALTALTDPPDAANAPVQRSHAQRQADALVDLCFQWLADHGIDVEGNGAADGGDGDGDGEWLDDADADADADADGDGEGEWLDGDGEPSGEDAGQAEDTVDADGSEADGDEVVTDPWDVGDPGVAIRRARQARAERLTQHRSRRRARRSRGPATAVEVRVDLSVVTQPDGLPVDLAAESCDIVGLGPVARSTIERFTCDAWIGRQVTAGPSQVLDVGQRTPTFNRAQRRAIARRDQHCVYPGCARPHDWCDVHHLVHRQRGGGTSVDNGCLLCRWHHSTLHVRRQRLRRRADGSYDLLECDE